MHAEALRGVGSRETTVCRIFRCHAEARRREGGWLFEKTCLGSAVALRALAGQVRAPLVCSASGPAQAVSRPGPCDPATSMPVVIGAGSHPFPFRTRKLSLLPPMVLHGKLCGRVGRCRQ